MTKLKIGVIGTGHLGKLHTKMFQQISNAELAGIYDSNPDNLSHVSKEFNTRAFGSVNELLENVDAVSIAVTTSEHFKVAFQCLESNKHVFIEKPITSLIIEGEKLVSLATDKKLFIQVGHIERFNPALLAVEEYIIQPMFIQSDRLAQFNPRGTDVAVVLDLMIHDIDIILSLIKSEVSHIDASGVAVVSDNIDIANARIQFVNGAVANVTASRISQKKMRKMRLFQKDNYISLDFIAGVAEVYRLVSAEKQLLTPAISFGEIGVGDKKKRVIYEQPEIKEVNALKYELELFVNSVLEKKNPVVTGDDGLRALKVAEIIIEKIEESKVNV
ncbi:MAG: Gfo/Idh/MocA family oxidoreductase [Ignavibacteriaceae bacterium]|nr:Gfo/Idh/MocA family oxidoreductase [Ignavibacteriaceae bacterium]